MPLSANISLLPFLRKQLESTAFDDSTSEEDDDVMMGTLGGGNTPAPITSPPLQFRGVDDLDQMSE